MTTDHTRKVANIFREARQKQGLTQSQAAGKAGLNSNHYAKIERGEQDPSTESLRKIVKALNIDPSKVL
jgi:transcriptional regulator with XRE-family HTH domain